MENLSRVGLVGPVGVSWGCQEFGLCGNLGRGVTDPIVPPRAHVWCDDCWCDCGSGTQKFRVDKTSAMERIIRYKYKMKLRDACLPVRRLYRNIPRNAVEANRGPPSSPILPPRTIRDPQ